MDAPHPENARWFADEVQPHDASLKAYLRGAFPGVRDVEDVVQESYLRIWRAQARGSVASARHFLFRVARNLALDLVRRDRRSPVRTVEDPAALGAADEAPSARSAAETAERVALLAAALDALSPRHREVVILCKLQARSHREAAALLGISEKTVAEHLYRAIQRLGEELQRLGVEAFRR